MGTPENEMEQFAKAYEEFGDAIFRHCFFRVRDRERAKDLMQDAFMKTWQYMSNGGSVKEMRPFLYKVANNLIIDWSRRKRESSLESLQEKGFDPGTDYQDVMISAIDAKAIVRVIDGMDSKYRDAVIMRFIDELTPKEIAEILGETENNISVRIHRGLQEVRKRIAYEKDI